MTSRIMLVLGALLAALGVMLGAFHAHGMEKWLTRSAATPAEVARLMQNADVAIRYQLLHAVAFLVLGTILATRGNRVLSAGCWLLIGGLTLFSGGLYLIVFLGTAIHWAIVPLGGVTMIGAWLVIAVGLVWKPGP